MWYTVYVSFFPLPCRGAGWGQVMLGKGGGGGEQREKKKKIGKK